MQEASEGYRKHATGERASNVASKLSGKQERYTKVRRKCRNITI
jgi:hypothetical protein